MVYIFTILVWLILDQATKLYIQANFALYQPHVVIPNFLNITYATNTGGAFSLMSQHPGFFLILSSVLTAVGIFLIWSIAKLPFMYQLALGSVIGGAAGNLVDRIRIGKVIDFIAFSFWPTFNVADIAICVGVVLLMILLFKEKTVEYNTSSTSDEPAGDKTSTSYHVDAGQNISTGSLVMQPGVSVPSPGLTVSGTAENLSGQM